MWGWGGSVLIVSMFAFLLLQFLSLPLHDVSLLVCLSHLDQLEDLSLGLRGPPGPPGRGSRGEPGRRGQRGFQGNKMFVGFHCLRSFVFISKTDHLQIII